MPASRPETVEKVIPVGEQAPAPWLRQVQEALGQSRPLGIAPILSMRVESNKIYIERLRVDGETLEDRLRRGAMAPEECVAICKDIAQALLSLHDRGVLHGNLKPSNIILGEATTLVDYGIASLRDPLALPATSAGRYLSPEQAGLLDYETGEWSDLYALGTIMYECLAGRPPFEAPTLGAILRHHLNTAPASLRDQGIDVPGPLEDLVLRLLRKDPRERYQTASGLLHDLKTMQHGTKVVVGAEDQRQHLTDPAFLGRASDLDSLGEALDQARQGRAALCYVEAESGGGKTRLLQEFAHRARLEGAWITYGQGRDQVAPRPFGMLDGLDESMGTLRAIAPQEAGRILEGAAADAAAIVQALPALQRHFGAIPAPESDPDEYGQARTLGALTRLLMALGSAQQPAILLLDDLQWADSPTRRLLTEWWHEASTQECYLVVVAAFRAEEVPEDDIVRSLETDHWLRLVPFDHNDIEGLVRSMAGPVEAPAIEFVARMADGNPFMASAVLRGLVESEDLQPAASGWRLRPNADLVGGDATMVEFLLTRMRHLTDDARRLLAVAAILGKEFEADLAAGLAGLSADATLLTLHAARQRHILIHTDRQGTFAFTHDKLREAILAGLDPDERTDLHRAAARRLQATAAEATFDLAYHFDAAGDPTSALPHALAAAEQARRRFVLDVAEQYYLIAKRGMQGAEAATQFRVLSGMGETLMLRGDYPAAAPWFEKAQAVAADDVERAHLAGRIGDLWFKQGDLHRASDAIVQGLKMLGEPAPTTHAGHVIRLPWEVLVQTWSSMRPKRIGRKEGAATQDRDLLAADLYSSMAHVNWFLRGPVCTAFSHLREMNIAEKYAPTAQTAMAYAEHSVVMTTAPWHKRGIDYGRRALDVRTRLDQAWGQGHARHFYALGLLASGRLDMALEEVQEAGRIFQRTGDLWQANNAGWNAAYILGRQGDSEAALRIARQYFDAADRIGDLQNTGLALWAWAYAGGDGITRELLDREIERCPEMDAQTGEAVYQAEGLWLIRHGDPAAAVVAFERAQRVAASASLRSEYVAGIPIWIATAARLAADAAPAWDRAQRQAYRRLAAAGLRRGRMQITGYPCHRPQMLRERAYQFARRGWMGRARRSLAKSVEEADRLGMLMESWESRQVYQEMGGRTWPELDPMVTIPKRALEDHGATLSIADRFQSLIDNGRHIAAALQESDVVDRLEAAAAETLRGDTVAVLDLADPPADYKVIADLASRLAGPLAVQDPDTLRVLGVRSAIVVPIHRRDEVPYAVLVMHHHLADLYQQQELATGRFLGALAGVALENASGYVALERSRDKERLQTSLLRSQAEAMVEAAIVVDDRQRILTVNQRLQTMWAIPHHVMDSDDARMVFSTIGGALDSPHAWDGFVQQMQDDQYGSDRIGLRLSDGRIIDAYTAPVVDGDRRYGRAWYFRDVTRELRDQESLREAYDRLQDVDRMKTAFLNTAAHELNTPLTPIKLQLSMLQSQLSGRLEGNEQDAFDVLKRNIDRLQSLIQDILDTVKLEGSRLRIQPEEVDVLHVVQEVAASFAPQARSRGIEMVVEGTQAHVRADPARLHQVLFNLVSNAMRFCDRQVGIHVLDGADVRIRISDDGLGLTADQKARLFEPFSQPVESPKGQALGTGLGLHICRGIIEEHGGEILVDSEGPGTGATFTVVLPR